MLPHGQAAVETALVTPVSLFAILGVLQMGLVQQARMLTDYAAFRGARVCSAERCDCDQVKRAELAALIPTLGRADDRRGWLATWEGMAGPGNSPLLAVPKTNSRGTFPILVTYWAVENKHTPFDEPLDPGQAVEQVHLEMAYFYEMKVPFVNWLLAAYFLAEAGTRAYFDQQENIIHPTGHGNNPGALTAQGISIGSAALAAQAAYLDQHYRRGVYVVPIYASWSMRMFSQVSSLAKLCPAP